MRREQEAEERSWLLQCELFASGEECAGDFPVVRRMQRQLRRARGATVARRNDGAGENPAWRRLSVAGVPNQSAETGSDIKNGGCFVA